MRKLSRPIYLFIHHKTGTQMHESVFFDICQEMEWSFASFSPSKDQIDVVFDHDVVIFYSTRFKEIEAAIYDSAFLGVHNVRDPRDLVVSGYQYHLRCEEKWCVNPGYCRQRCPVCMDGGHGIGEDVELSYQQILRKRSMEEGLVYEIRHMAAKTIADMVGWKKHPFVLETRFEDYMGAFDGTYRQVFEWLGFSGQKIERCLEIARRHDVARMSDEKVSRNVHITSRRTSRWKDFIVGKVADEFETTLGHSVELLGYSP